MRDKKLVIQKRLPTVISIAPEIYKRIDKVCRENSDVYVEIRNELIKDNKSQKDIRIETLLASTPFPQMIFELKMFQKEYKYLFDKRM